MSESVQTQDTVKQEEKAQEDTKEEDKQEEKTEEDSEEDDEDAGNVSYQVLKAFWSDLALLLESSCVPLATRLAAKDFIADNVRSAIVLRRITPSNSERMQVLLMFIYERMKNSKNPRKLMEKFKQLLDDKVYSELVKKLGKSYSGYIINCRSWSYDS